MFKIFFVSMHVLLRVMAVKFTVAAALELFWGRSGMCSGLFALFWRLPVSEASVPFICQWIRVNWRTELNWSGLHWDCVWMRVVCACLYLYIDRCVCVCVTGTSCLRKYSLRWKNICLRGKTHKVAVCCTLLDCIQPIEEQRFCTDQTLVYS